MEKKGHWLGFHQRSPILIFCPCFFFFLFSCLCNFPMFSIFELLILSIISYEQHINVILLFHFTAPSLPERKLWKKFVPSDHTIGPYDYINKITTIGGKSVRVVKYCPDRDPCFLQFNGFLVRSTRISYI